MVSILVSAQLPIIEKQYITERVKNILSTKQNSLPNQTEENNARCSTPTTCCSEIPLEYYSNTAIIKNFVSLEDDRMIYNIPSSHDPMTMKIIAELNSISFESMRDSTYRKDIPNIQTAWKSSDVIVYILDLTSKASFDTLCQQFNLLIAQKLFRRKAASHLNQQLVVIGVVPCSSSLSSARSPSLFAQMVMNWCAQKKDLADIYYTGFQPRYSPQELNYHEIEAFLQEIMEKSIERKCISTPTCCIPIQLPEQPQPSEQHKKGSLASASSDTNHTNSTKKLSLQNPAKEKHLHIASALSRGSGVPWQQLLEQGDHYYDKDDEFLEQQNLKELIRARRRTMIEKAIQEKIDADNDEEDDDDEVKDEAVEGQKFRQELGVSGKVEPTAAPPTPSSPSHSTTTIANTPVGSFRNGKDSSFMQYSPSRSRSTCGLSTSHDAKILIERSHDIILYSASVEVGEEMERVPLRKITANESFFWEDVDELDEEETSDNEDNEHDDFAHVFRNQAEKKTPQNVSFGIPPVVPNSPTSSKIKSKAELTHSAKVVSPHHSSKSQKTVNFEREEISKQRTTVQVETVNCTSCGFFWLKRKNTI